MSRSIKERILQTAGDIYDKSYDSHLKPEFFEEIDQDLDVLAHYFKVSKMEAFFIANILSFSCSDYRASYDRLASHFRCSSTKLLLYNEHVEQLCKRRILRKVNTSRRSRFVTEYYQYVEYYIHAPVLQIILRSEEFPDVLPLYDAFNDIYSLLSKVYDFILEVNEENMVEEELFETFNEIEASYQHFEFIRRLDGLGFTINQKLVFIQLTSLYLKGIQSFPIGGIFGASHGKDEDRKRMKQIFISGEYALVKNGWVEIEEAAFFDDARMCLTEKAEAILYDCKVLLRDPVDAIKKQEYILYPSQFPIRKLIFKDKQAEQLHFFQSLLQEDQFKQAQEKLLSKGMIKGFAALFYGQPGTGKTESVYQIAKATNRLIYKVDISKSRSLWFGESEKLIKKIFKEYRMLSKSFDLTPILFFNEADAIFSIRKELSQSEVSQTENRIQNILLEELERFEGILIATTNLVNNLDKAFERRFLFKIHFEQPNVDAKAEIWKTKMPALTSQECSILADSFDFTGGQIDNVIRKIEIDELLYNHTLKFSQIIQFCKEEGMIKDKVQQIGFAGIRNDEYGGTN